MAESCKEKCPIYLLLSSDTAEMRRVSAMDIHRYLKMSDDIAAIEDQVDVSQLKKRGRRLLKQAKNLRPEIIKATDIKDQIVSSNERELKNITDRCPGVEIEEVGGLTITCGGFTLEGLQELISSVRKSNDNQPYIPDVLG